MIDYKYVLPNPYHIIFEDGSVRTWCHTDPFTNLPEPIRQAYMNINKVAPIGYAWLFVPAYLRRFFNASVALHIPKYIPSQYAHVVDPLQTMSVQIRCDDSFQLLPCETIRAFIDRMLQVITVPFRRLNLFLDPLTSVDNLAGIANLASVNNLSGIASLSGTHRVSPVITTLEFRNELQMNAEQLFDLQAYTCTYTDNVITCHYIGTLRPAHQIVFFKDKRWSIQAEMFTEVVLDEEVLTCIQQMISDITAGTAWRNR